MPNQYEPQSIHPELMEASPWLRDTAGFLNDLMVNGIDPQTALAIMASVPVILRVLRMLNELTTAAIEDWAGKRKIERMKQAGKARIELAALERHHGITPHAKAPTATEGIYDEVFGET